MKKSEVSKVISQAAKSGFIESEINDKVQERIDDILKEEIKSEKNEIKKIIREKFDGNYDLVQAFYRKQLSY